jgi:hypothetical protein
MKGLDKLSRKADFPTIAFTVGTTGFLAAQRGLNRQAREGARQAR